MALPGQPDSGDSSEERKKTGFSPILVPREESKKKVLEEMGIVEELPEEQLPETYAVFEVPMLEVYQMYSAESTYEAELRNLELGTVPSRAWGLYNARTLTIHTMQMMYEAFCKRAGLKVVRHERVKDMWAGIDVTRSYMQDHAKTGQSPSHTAAASTIRHKRAHSETIRPSTE